MRNVFLVGAASLALIPGTAFGQQQIDQRASAQADQPTNQNDIIVTASPFDLDRDETPTISAKVDREKIITSGGANLADALKDVPGISATGFASGASRPIIRGLSTTRVRVLENGLSLSDVSDTGPDHGNPVDPLSARSIEVVRGAAALRYGSQAIGGVVNALNNRVPTLLPTTDLSGEVTGSYGSVDDSGQGSILGDGRSGNLAVHVDGFYRRTGDYSIPGGTQQNSFFHGYGQSVGASYFFGGGDSHVGAGIEHYDAQYGIPSDDTFLDVRETKYVTRSAFDLGSGLLKKLTVDAAYGNYRHDEDEPGGAIVTTFKNKEFDGRSELLLAPIGPIENTAVGIEIQRRRFQALGEDSSYLFPTLTQSEAGYLLTNLPISGRFRIAASGRIEQVHVEGTPRSDVFTTRNFTPLSGSVGALYDVGRAIKLGLNFSSTGRAPAITELFARGGHDGPNTFETGDPDLSIERSNSLEGTLRVDTGRFRFEGSAYSTWFNDFIYGDLTGRTCDDDGNCVPGGDRDLRELNYRQQGAHFRGLEGQASYRIIDAPGGGLEVQGLADYVRATLDDGNNVPRIPPYRYGGGLAYTSTRFDAGALFLHSGRQDDFGVFDTPTAGFNELTAQVVVRPFRQYPGIELAVVGQNLTNDTQRNAAAFNKDVVVLPGRNIRVVLKAATF